MDQLERRVTDRLTATGKRGEVPAYLADRIVHMIRTRERRRRRVMVLGAAVAVAAVLTIPAVGVVDQRTDAPDPTTLPLTQPPADPPAVIGTGPIVAIPRQLPGGSVLQARTLDADGTVVGIGVRDGEWDPQMWMASPGEPVPLALDGPQVAEAASFAVVSEQTLFWVERRDEPHDLFTVCADLRAAGPVHELGDNGMLRGSVPVLADEGLGVWTDQGRDPSSDRDEPATVPATVWLARGCGDEPQAVARDAEAVAFAYPDLFVRPLTASDTDDGNAPMLVQLDVETGRVTGELTLPRNLAMGEEDRSVRFAVNETTLAWADGEALTLAERHGGTPDRMVVDLPTSTGSNGTEILLTIGNHIVAYSSIPITISGDPSYSAKSIVFDLRTGEHHALNGMAYAAGDWLLWEGGDRGAASYYLGRVAN